MNTSQKLYKAMIWPDGENKPGQRVEVFAANPFEAREKIELEYETKEVFDLHNPEDAEKPR